MTTHTRPRFIGLFIGLLLALFPLAALAAPPLLPTTLTGRLALNGAPAADGTVITALINGTELASATVYSFGGIAGRYVLIVPGDDPATLGQIEGGVQGQSISFGVSGATIAETASWATGSLLRLDLTASPSVTADVSIPTISGKPAQIVQVPITVNTSVSNLLAASLTVSYDSRVLRPHGSMAVPGTLTTGWGLAVNALGTDQIRLAMASPASGVSGTGTLAILEFEVIGSAGMHSPLHFVKLQLNDGALAATTQDGALNIPLDTYTVNVTAHTSGGIALAGVGVNVAQQTSLTCTTDSTGRCDLLGLTKGTRTITPAKSDATNGNIPSGIMHYDASLVLQHDAGLIILTGNALLAGDVNHDGQVTAMDANQILKYAAGLITLPFSGAGEVWHFLPERYTYAPLTSDQQPDFTGILLGDVSAEYTPSLQGMRSPQDTTRMGIATSDSVAIQVLLGSQPDANGFMTDRIKIVPGANPVYSMGWELTYDPATVSEMVVQPTNTANGFAIVTNTKTPGTLRVAMAGATPLTRDTVVLSVRYRATTAPTFTLAQGDSNQGTAIGQMPPILDQAQSMLYLPLIQR